MSSKLQKHAHNWLDYYRRLFKVYLTPSKSNITFWHERPEVNPHFQVDKLGEYYMTFRDKANYSGEFDSEGIPLLNYQGEIGLQYNPIAIAQYGLANYNVFRGTNSPSHYSKFIRVADWLASNLERNQKGLWVWNHHFEWRYRTSLKAPWYSALAQGQGISVLVRANQETGDRNYLDKARLAFEAFLKRTNEGGVVYVDSEDYTWFEEYIVAPPTHILNGFIWASWGVYDYFLTTGDSRAQKLFEEAIKTLRHYLPKYDVGFWSLYEQSTTKLKMIASPFYHRLHIVQLKILYQLTGEETFAHFAVKWEGYRKNILNSTSALFYKAVFKLCYY